MRRFIQSRWTRIGLMVATLGVAFFGIPALVHAADPNGADTIAANPNAGLNMAWTLIAGFLVFFMQLGFAFLGAGLIRSKNTMNYMTKSFLDFCIASLGFWAFGFALMFGGSKLWPGLEDGNTVIGFSGFFLTGENYDVSTIMGWFFQMVFAATAATIVAGAVAERMKITAYLAYSFIIGALIYPIYGHWMWGGGWLGTLHIGGAIGARDFAGSGVVHTVGGLAALVGAWMVGPRIGKFNSDGTPNLIKGHNLPYVAIGTFILFFGWFGFNPGSTLAATDLRISVIAVNTFLAGATGAVVAMYWKFARTGKADLVLACNGALAGLVAITAPCAFVAPWAAVVIGAVAAPVMIGTAYLVERVLKVDDVVGAVPVHAGAGIWGLLAVGIFADGTYLDVSGLVDGSANQLVLQIIDVLVVIAWTVATAAITFYAIKKTIGLRASKEEELAGLDVPEHGTEAYPADVPVRVAAATGAAD
ncbi:MAG: ammonium transporter [Chloroflexi bacterium]|nr:ammonium transporter [Chloroflexota bacterium]